MKVVKKSISLPEPLFKFAEKKAQKLAKDRGSSTNLSAYLRELVLEDRRRDEMAQAA